MLKEPTEVIFLEIINYIVYFHCAVCLVIQLCLTLRDPMDCSPPGSSVYGISKQEYWSGLPFPPTRDFPDLGI